MKRLLTEKLKRVIEKLQATGEWPDFSVPEICVDCPKNGGFGDYTTNIAMVLAKAVKKSPMEIAEVIAERLQNSFVKDSQFEKTEVVTPGYINFYLSKKHLQTIVEKILAEEGDYGNCESGRGIKVNNEFVSANPTGPLHLGNGRGGFFGDSLSRVLRKASYDVTNEYYVNDAGEQVMKLGHSVLKDDEAVYGGEYVDELNTRLLKEGVTDVWAAGLWATEKILEEHIKKTITNKMDVQFDSWIFEKSGIVETGYVDRAIEVLRDKGFTFENEGALWLRTTGFGDDKDRVLVKKDGTKTYFASDCGYILQKMDRGFQMFIETWGADHHGYIARFRAAAQALGFEGNLRFVIVQLVRLMKDGKEVRMSKRAGNVVTIDELIEKVGQDVARFFFLMYSPDTHMNFDLGLAEERSQKNPVFYVQYAHARLSNILVKAVTNGWDTKMEADVSLLKHEKEVALMKELSLFPELMKSVAENFTVHQLPQYAIRLADRLHSFYDECRVVDTENRELSQARLQLVKAVKIVLGETLRLIGVAAPERM